MFGIIGDTGGTLTFRAPAAGVFLAVCVTTLVQMCLLAIYDEFKPPTTVAWIVSVSLFVLVLWRFVRVGVKVTPQGLTFLSVIKDEQVPWQVVRGVSLGDSAGSLGHTNVPVIEIEGEEEEMELGWLAGYTFRKNNR